MLDRTLEILVVDDHDLIRKGAAELLSGLGDSATISDVATLADAEIFLRQKTSLDLIVLDLVLPDVSGLEGLKRLKSISPETPVAILSGIVSHDQIHEALDNGADGYIPKSVSAEIMLQAIHLILQGEVYIPSVYLRGMRNNSKDTTASGENFAKRLARLTTRQDEVLRLIVDGLSNKEIAMRLNCAESTVKTHVSAILAALEVTTRGKLVAAYTVMNNDLRSC